MRVYVIRHGESKTILSIRWTGWFVAALTEKGYEDAKKAGKIIGDVTFDKVFSSDLRRAKETAMTALPGCCPVTTPLLREINVGSLAGQPLSCLTKEINEMIAESGYKKLGGESYEELGERISAFREQLESLDCETAAVFTHAGWLRGFLDQVVGVSLSRDRVKCGNCTVGIFDYTGGKWRLHSWINLN